MIVNGMRTAFLISLSASALFADTLSYTIIDQQVLGNFVSSKFIMKALVNVEELPSGSNMKTTAEAIWKDGNTLWNNFTLFLYLPGMNHEGAAYCFCEFSHGGLQKYEVQKFAIKGTRWEKKKPQKVKKPAKKKAEKPVLVYTLSLQVKKMTEGRSVDILVLTNFPEGTNLQLKVARPFFQREKDEEFFGILQEETCAVKEGRIDRRYTIDDSKWYYKTVNQKGGTKRSEECFTKFKSISPRIKVSVAYSPEIPQPDSVSRILGPNADYVAGKDTGKIGYGKPYIVEKYIEVHFTR
ncbi:MAG: hypothetical protein GF350_09020 [Chitinivibrionales bacterium]|nr:hypothetical protein [Chitinivibrionales bacterium]